MPCTSLTGRGAGYDLVVSVYHLSVVGAVGSGPFRCCGWFRVVEVEVVVEVVVW